MIAHGCAGAVIVDSARLGPDVQRSALPSFAGVPSGCAAYFPTVPGHTRNAAGGGPRLRQAIKVTYRQACLLLRTFGGAVAVRARPESRSGHHMSRTASN